MSAATMVQGQGTVTADPLTALAGLLAMVSLVLPVGAGQGPAIASAVPLLTAVLLVGTAAAALVRSGPWAIAALAVGAHLAAFLCLVTLQEIEGLPRSGKFVGPAGIGFWLQVIASWLLASSLVSRLSRLSLRSRMWIRLRDLAAPVLFGIWLLLLWEFVVRGFGVPPVLLPAPSAIGERIAASLPILAADFRQTFLKAVLAGYAIGCGAGFLVALLVDRVDFLKRGLLPIGNLVSALPIVGIAPIMVMWFGFDWPSKAAVVVVMTFFPMLVNTVAGLAAADAMQRDLMRTYAASPAQALVKLRLPAALPFIFNALKINSTLALIGAIVAEFFGTPIVGMGFRISTEIGRMNVDMVWAEIAMAALAGSAFYGIVALIERAATFWHPSMRGG